MRNRRDIVTSVVFLGLSAIIYSVVKDYPTGTVQEGMGARLFPFLLTISLAALSLVLLVQASLQRNAPDETEHLSGTDALMNRRFVIPGVLVILLALYLLFLEEAGFLIATPIFLVLTMRVLGSGLKEAAAVGVSFTVGVYLIFDFLLKVPLPEIPFLRS